VEVASRKVEVEMCCIWKSKMEIEAEAEAGSKDRNITEHFPILFYLINVICIYVKFVLF
jgi:hypothetical protein